MKFDWNWKLDFIFNLHNIQFELKMKSSWKLSNFNFNLLLVKKLIETEMAIKYMDSTSNHLFQWNITSYIKQGRWHRVACALHLFTKEYKILNTLFFYKNQMIFTQPRCSYFFWSIWVSKCFFPALKSYLKITLLMVIPASEDYNYIYFFGLYRLLYNLSVMTYYLSLYNR